MEDSAYSNERTNFSKQPQKSVKEWFTIARVACPKFMLMVSDFKVPHFLFPFSCIY